MKTEKKKTNKIILAFAGLSFLFLIIVLIIPKEEIKPELTRAEIDSIKIASQFDRWDGSHIKTREAIQSMMNDPESYENVETRYIQYASNDTLMKVVVKFRGKNQFGGVVTQVYTSLIDTAGNVIDLREIN